MPAAALAETGPVYRTPHGNRANSEANSELRRYITWLNATTKRLNDEYSRDRIEEIDYPPHQDRDMASAFDARDPASPTCYNGSETALLLLDFHAFVVDHCGQAGKDALAKAVELRKWAQKNGMLILHGLVNVNVDPAPTRKGYDRTKGFIALMRDNKAAAEEVPELASGRQEKEHYVLKTPGVISNLKEGGTELLREHGIKSLIVCGLSTSGCVLRTAVPATDDGFVVTVVSDACTDPKEGVHKTLVEDVLPGAAHVVTAAEIMKEWDSSVKERE